jgi:phosphotransferase system HPr (HPr) family protein
MIEETLVIKHPQGLHARPAADFYRKTREFKSSVTIQNLSRPGTSEVPVSMLNLLQIGAAHGHALRVRVHGEDERDALLALAAVIEQQNGGE